MYSTIEVKRVMLCEKRPSTLEILKEFPRTQLIAKGNRYATINAYTRPNGKDVNSLKVYISSTEGCTIADESTFITFEYDFSRKAANLLFDRSKILPTTDNGRIIMEVTGNYKFKELLSLPWTIKKELPVITEDWIRVEDVENPVRWKNGKIVVSIVSIAVPENVSNSIWYRIPDISVELDGAEAKNFSLNPLNSKSHSSLSCQIIYNCTDSISEHTKKAIDIMLCLNGKAVARKNKLIEMIPAMRNVQIKLKSSKQEYILGSEDTLIARYELKNECEDCNAIAKVRIHIDCEETFVFCEKQEVEVNAKQPVQVEIKILREKLTELPNKDIDFKVDFVGCDKYTVCDFSEQFVFEK